MNHRRASADWISQQHSQLEKTIDIKTMKLAETVNKTNQRACPKKIKGKTLIRSQISSDFEKEFLGQAIILAR